MNQKSFSKTRVFTLNILVTLVALLTFSLGVQAHPYASGVTGTNANGDVGFFMNEAGATVNVIFEDSSTLSLQSISTIVVTAGGTNYTTAPTVTITGGGSGATATATLSTTGTVASVTVTSGGTYYSVPTIGFTGGDGSNAVATATLGTLAKGTNSFPVGAHTSWAISCFKQGTGNPTLISSDTFTNSAWTNSTGVAINHFPKIGTNFGRLYAGNNFPTPGTAPKAVGIYAMNADQTLVAFAGPTNIPGTVNTWGMVANGNFKSPGRMRVAPNGKLLVADSRGAGNQNRVYMFEPDLSSAVALLGPSTSSGAGDLFGTPVATGSLETGDLVLYTAAAGESAPPINIWGTDATNCILGPLTFQGSFNCVFRYNIGSGPIPWNKRPDYAYTVGLDGIAQLRPEVDIGPDGKVYAGFGRANLSNPNLQILRPALTTNGITGDLANKAIQDAAKDKTNWLYTSGVTPPFNNPPVSDPWNGGGFVGSVGILGTYGGIRVSPDGQWITSLDNNNQLTVANLTNGIPNDGTIFGITNSSAAGNQAGVDWDAADNIWVMCRAALPTSVGAQSRLRCWSLGLTTTCVTSNDWTGTNGTFQLLAPPVTGSLAVINPTASQNYINNTVNAGTPIPGVFRISLNTNDTTALGPTFVGFVRTGTAVPATVGIASIAVTDGGTNYATAPTVTFTGGGGSGAAATATLSTTGTVATVTVTAFGTGYTSTPTIGFTGGGGGSNATATATLGQTNGNFTININETPNGVTVLPNGVIFPAGVFSGSNGPNWNVDVKITPTAIPVSGQTLGVNVRLLSGTNYSAQAPIAGNIAILNTGPQLLQLAAAAPASLGGMNRGIPNDYARFVITRLGDLNGPDNDAVTVTPKSYTVTNINFLAPVLGGPNNIRGQAILSVDYTAGSQNFSGSLPSDGSPGITIASGVVTIPAMIGNPVKHINTSLARSNLAVLINLTNTVAIGGPNGIPAGTTNAASTENYLYSVAINSLTLNEFDNAVGGEVVLWSNPLTNSFDSTNWTLVYAGVSQGASPTLPTVISNYDNSAAGPGDYTAWFGKSVLDPGGDDGIIVPQSAVMVANGWTNALKLSVNKNPANATESGINLYPQIPGAPWDPTNYMAFGGNYALRFDMFISLYRYGLNNPTIGTPAREFAAFGINHFGTNANWRLDINPRGDGTGARPINADGEWCSIGAASGSITPADYDMFISPAWALVDTNGVITPQQVPFNTTFFTNQVASPSFSPLTNAYQNSPGNYSLVTNFFANAGVPNDQQSANNNGAAAQNGIIKNPPFSGINANGGAPDNAWVDVSLELSRQTNLTLKIAQQTIFSGSILTPLFGTANAIARYTGTPMLGYLDPNRDISDYSAFVYYSNIRLVELSPFIPLTNQPVAGLIVTQGASFSLSSGATFASNPLTNTWYRGSTNGAFILNSRENGTPITAVATNVFNDTNGIATLTVNNIQGGTNYISVWSDQAGAVTNYITVVEVIAGPGNKTALVGSTTNFTVVPTGNKPPTSFQWRSNDVNLANSAKYAGVTTASLFITNVTAADAAVYSCLVANADGSAVAAGTLTVKFGNEPYQFSSISNLATTVELSFTTTDPTDIAGSFTLQSAGIVTGPYTNNTTGIFTGANPDFLVTVPKTGTMLYFRLKHN